MRGPSRHPRLATIAVVVSAMAIGMLLRGALDEAADAHRHGTSNVSPADGASVARMTGGK